MTPRQIHATVGRVHARSSTIVFALILGGLDALAIAMLRPAPSVAAGHVDDLARAGGGQNETAAEPGLAAPPRPPRPEDVDNNWALCLTKFEGKELTPILVAVTYLDAGLDTEVTPNEIRSWFGELDGSMIEVWALEQRDGRRRVSFELSRARWPGWDQVAAGQTGEAVCGLVRQALLRAGVGRPRPDSTGEVTELDRSRHDFEFLYARRPKIYRTVEWLGTLDHVSELQRFAEIRTWLNGAPP